MLVSRQASRGTSLLFTVLLLTSAFAVKDPIITGPSFDWEPSYVKLQNGVEVLAYAEGPPINQDIYMMLKEGSSWGQPFPVDLGGIGDVSNDNFPDLVELSGNRVMVVWSQCPTSTNCNIVYNIYSFTAPTGEEWNSCGFGESCFTIVRDDNLSNTGPSAIVKPSGEVCVFYHTTTNPDIYYVCFNEIDPIPSPTKMPLSSSTSPDYFASAVLNKGLVWLAWNVQDDKIYLTNNDLSLNPSSWAAPVLLVTSSGEDRRPSLGVTGDEGLWLLWESTRDASPTSPETNIYYKRSMDPMNINSWLPDALLVGEVGNDVSPSPVDVEPGVLGIMFATNRGGDLTGYDLYYTTIVRRTGDTDWDGNIDLEDLIATYVAQFSTDPVNLYRCDIDRDGNVDLEDLIMVYVRQFT